MQKTVIRVLAVGGSALLWFVRGTVESWFFDKVLDMTPPFPDWSWVIEYGPPAALAITALWLFVSGRQKPQQGNALEAQARADKARQMRLKEERIKERTARREFDDPNRKRLLEQLSACMVQGRDLMARFTNPRKGPIPSDEEVTAWQVQTETLIRKELGPIQYALYETPNGGSPSNFLPDQWQNQTWHGIKFRVQNLKKIVEELRDSS